MKNYMESYLVSCWLDMSSFNFKFRTSSNTLTFSIYQLCKSPKIAEELYKEVQSIEFENTENIIETTMSLKYLDKFLREVQRMYSVVGAVARTTLKDINVCGYDLPKGTNVTCYLRACHMDPTNYPNPTEFNVDRWDNPQSAFFPFGDGPHNCIGQKMAVIETKVFTCSCRLY